MIVRAPFIPQIIGSIIDEFQKLHRNDYCCLGASGWTRAWWRLPGITGRLTPWRRHHACWPGPGRRPRVCTNCHSIHPEDAIALLRLGWDVDAIDSAWTGEAILIHSLEGCRPGFGFFPTPIVHRRHFTDKQRDEFNSILFQWLAGKTSVVQEGSALDLITRGSYSPRPIVRGRGARLKDR